jgi:branched-chain amino acid transport system substrate-binding protein
VELVRATDSFASGLTLGRPFLRAAGRLLFLGAAAALLSACGTNFGGLGKSTNEPDAGFNAPVGKVDSQPLDGVAASGASNTIGTGPVRVALILPLTSPNGQPSLVGQSLRNAAELALTESGSTNLTILVRDDHSSPDGARDAAQGALADGAELFIGPLFAADVREVSRVAQGAGKPVIAFSTDSTSASRGSWLLSFLIESYVDRIIDYAAARGKKSIAALIPDNDYGRVADAEFQQETAKKNIRVQTIEHYTPQMLDSSIKKIAALGGQIDSLFIPEQADAMTAMSSTLAANGIDGKRIQILGTGLWNDARVLNLPGLQGAWFAAPENEGFNRFAQRYRAKYGVDPTRIATLAYDSVSLAAALAKTQGSQRFAESVLLNKSGFNGADGVFRFRPDGLNDRGLAVLQINNGTAAPVSAAPRNFAQSSAM